MPIFPGRSRERNPVCLATLAVRAAGRRKPERVRRPSSQAAWLTAARLLQGFRVGVSSEGGVEFSFEASASAATGDLERDLTELLVQLGEVAREHRTGVAFFIDEMQFLKQVELEAVAAAMHRMSQKRLPVALAGTGLPQLPGLIVEAKSYAERLFAYPRLDRLDADAARAALILPAEEEGVVFDDKALARILDLSGAYPAFLQACGREAWNLIYSPEHGAVGLHRPALRCVHAPPLSVQRIALRSTSWSRLASGAGGSDDDPILILVNSGRHGVHAPTGPDFNLIVR